MCCIWCYCTALLHKMHSGKIKSVSYTEFQLKYGYYHRRDFFYKWWAFQKKSFVWKWLFKKFYDDRGYHYLEKNSVYKNFWIAQKRKMFSSSEIPSSLSMSLLALSHPKVHTYYNITLITLLLINVHTYIFTLHYIEKSVRKMRDKKNWTRIINILLLNIIMSSLS